MPAPLRDAYASTALLTDVAARSTRYLTAICDRRVAPEATALAGLAALDQPLQDDPLAPAAVIDELDRYAAPATVAIAGPRYFGFVNGGSLPAALAANWLAAAWDQNGSFHVSAPASAELERIAARWVIELLGLPTGSVGAFVTGTTPAHITALAAARNALLTRTGWNVEADGLFGAPALTVIVGAEAHPTVHKALGVLGLGRKRVITVPVDGQGRMRADLLPAITGPTILCVQAGNVNTGAFDPFAELAERVRTAASAVWIHADGAFGLWARAVPSLAGRAAGLELADSWATDGHKWLNTPYDSGLAIVRDRDALRRAMAVTADYLPPATGPANPSDYTMELSRRARGVDVWAALRSLGRRGLEQLILGHCRLARRFADGLTAGGLTVLNEVVLNQVLVALGDDARTRRVIAAIQDEGTCWCGPTVWQGTTAMRISVINWSTTDEDVDRSVEAILRVHRQA